MISILYVFVFLSGVAALVYQVVWARLLALGLGATTLAVSAVVASFMGGMGIGAGLFHRLDTLARRPLRTYAALELGIAGSAFVLTRALEVLPQGFAWLAADVPSGWATDSLRLAAAFPLLLVPAALMGATYPALCTVLIRSRRDVDRHLGMIYGLNTLGAAAGALLAGLLAVELLGLRGSATLAHALNLSVAAGAFVLAAGESRAEGAASEERADEALASDLPRRMIAVVLFGSGFATLAYEIVWFRALRYLVGNSTYALSDILVIFLIGLGCGALLYRPLVRRLRPSTALASCQLGIGLLALAAIAALQWILADPVLSDRLSIFSPVFRVRPWWWRLGATSLAALAILLPATLLMGLAFPIASRLYLDRVSAVARRTGVSYLIANLGSILGAVLAALLILPRLGTVGGTCALAALNLVLGIAVLASSPRTRRAVLPAAAACAGLLLAAVAWMPARLQFQGDDVVRYLVPLLLFEEEGDLATVQVRASSHDLSHRAMVIDGTVIGASRGWIPDMYAKQVLLAHLPMALDPRIRTTLNVGLGSCSTLAALSTYPQVETLDAVEINGAVLDAASYFEEAAVLADPRTRVEIEDATHHLLRHPGRYDLIISDGKQNEDFSGNARILSREFYEFASRSLTPCGLFVQWIPITTRPEDLEIVLRTLLEVFDEVEVFFSSPNSVFMIGSVCPIHGRAGPAPRAGTPPELPRLGFASVEDVLARWVASGPQLRAMLGEGVVNTTDRMPLEFSVYRALPSRDADMARNLRLLLGADAAAPSEAQEAFAPRDAAASRAARALAEAYLQGWEGDVLGAVRSARELLREHPEMSQARLVIRRFSQQ